MGIVAQESIEEIKEKANLVDIIGEAVSLKRRGSSYVGLCPFHAEKTPSFHVREEKFYHCFGCGESGNVISFVMRFRGLSFPEAIEELAGRCGVQLKFEKSGRKNVPLADKQALFKVNALALAWFSAQLKSAPPQVKDYINSRSLTREALAAFAIGFAPKEWSALTTFLRARKVPDEMILRCGLARRSPKGDLFDVFRARIIFPIFSDSKRVAAFGGRIIPELLEKEALNQAPKYLNSPESPIYFKSKVLFGLPQALSAIQQEREVWIVEGYMDVIGMWQAGIRNAVATCGTALTSEHAKRLKLLVKKVILLFDGDDAGRGAAGKAYDAFLNSGIDVCAAFLPQGEDPDSFVGKEAGAGAIERLRALTRKSLLECLVENLTRKYGADSVSSLGAASKGALCEELAKALRGVKNKIEQDELIDKAAFILRVSAQELARMTGGAEVGHGPSSRSEIQPSRSVLPASTAAQVTELPKVQREILMAVMACKAALTGKLLNDPALTAELDPVVLRFVAELGDILDSEIEEKIVKESIKTLLLQYGASWLQLWRTAHEMAEDPEVDMLKVFEQCRRAVQKSKTIQLLRHIEKIRSETLDEIQRVKLLHDEINLRKQLQAASE